MIQMTRCSVPQLFLLHVRSLNTLSRLQFLHRHFPRMIYPPHLPRQNILRYASTVVISVLSRISFNHQLQSRRRQRVIPPEEDIRRLFQECKIARGNADLLSQTLAFARPDALDADLIPVSSLFYRVRSLTNAPCRNSLLNVAPLRS